MGLGNPIPASSDNELSTDTELNQPSISELVTLLRSAFRSSMFDKVEEILIARESKLLKKIAFKERQFSLTMMDKLQAEEDLEICKGNCDEKKNTLRVRNDTCLELQEELKRSDSSLSDLNIKNLTLEAAKTRAEAEVRALRAKVEDFHHRVMHLEKEFKEFEKLSYLRTQVKLETNEDTFSNLGTNHSKERFRDSLSAGSMQDIANLKPGLTEYQRSDWKENSRLSKGTGTGHRMIESTGVILITDSDDDDEFGPRGTSGARDRTPQSIAETEGHLAIKKESVKPNVIDSLKRKWVAGEFLHNSTLLTGDLNSDSEVSSSSSSDSDAAVDDREKKKLRTSLNLDTNIPTNFK